MHIDDLPRAKKLVDELVLWREVIQRCDPGIFKAAQLVVSDATHGAQGIPVTAGGSPVQNGQTIVPLEPKYVLPIAQAHVERIIGELRELKVDV